jgi:kynurenine--oxoglutarate transaminase/cysteine-S-conjugate beta-lyase/glutamine--phenylpyruvate transaminase
MKFYTQASTFTLMLSTSSILVSSFTPINTIRSTIIQQQSQQSSQQSQTTILRSIQERVENLIDEVPSASSQQEQPQETTDLSSYQGSAIQRLGQFTGPTVWTEFGRIAAENPNNANLGQGFPDWLPPKFAIDALVEGATDVAHNSPHQYTRTAGHPKLVKELAGRYSKHLKRDVDPLAEVAITIGASQALYLSLQTLIQPCDEVILFEPFFDLYVNQIKLAGGTPVYVPLTFKPYNNEEQDQNENTISPGEWVLEPHNLSNKITNKTRAIILNSPHNPTGKIFTRSEMESIATAVTENAGPQCVVLSDEVYKYIVHSPPREEMEEEEAALFEEQTTHSTSTTNGNGGEEVMGEKYRPVICQGHVHFASLPGMWDRTITISSAGKTFSATGWQVGWAIGPKELIAPMHQLLPYVQFCASTVIQEALARALPKADLPYEGYASYYEYLKAMYTRKRDLLGNALKSAGFAVPDYDKTPGGGFFIFARIGKQISDSIPAERINAYNAAAPGNVARKDWALCQWMAEEKGINCIPASPFFSEETVTGEDPLSDQFIRIAFCKTNETIHKAADKLMMLNEKVVVDEPLTVEK